MSAFIGGGGSATPPGNDTEVVFNDAGAFGADSGFTYVKADDKVLVGKINSGEYQVGNQKVVGDRQSAITTPTNTFAAGSDTVDITTLTNTLGEHQTTLEQMLAAIRSHGLIAT